MIAGLWISGGASSSGVGIANASHIRANKHRNYDTKVYRKSGAYFLFVSLDLYGFFVFL